MKQQQIQSLIEALAASPLEELEYSEGGCTLRLARRAGVRPPATAPAEAPAAAGAPADAPPDAAAPASACVAPMYGVVHLQSAPGLAPFVQVGDRVERGQTLCVVEAMKVFNEVRAAADGRIAEVLVATGDEVEAGQPLFALA